MTQPRTEAGRELVSLWTRHGNPMAGEIRERVLAIEAEALPDVDELAKIIREVDGNHDLGAGELAEQILARLSVNEGSGAPGEAST